MVRYLEVQQLMDDGFGPKGGWLAEQVLVGSTENVGLDVLQTEPVLVEHLRQLNGFGDAEPL